MGVGSSPTCSGQRWRVVSLWRTSTRRTVSGVNLVAPPLRSRARALPVAVALVVLATGCGSTVQLSGSATVGGDGFGTTARADVLPGDDAGLGPVAGATGTTPTAGGSTVSGTGSGTATGGSPGSHTAPGSPGTSPVPGGPAAAGLPAKGFGYDEKNVYFGVVTQNDAQKAFARLRRQSGRPGRHARSGDGHGDLPQCTGRDPRPQDRASVAKDVATVATATSPVQAGTEVCTYFTAGPAGHRGDEHRHADGLPGIPCLPGQEAGHAVQRHAQDRRRQGAADLAPYFTQTVMPFRGRSWPPCSSRRLKAQGWFSALERAHRYAGDRAKSRVGIVTDSTAAGKRTASLLQAEIARAGYPGSVMYTYAQASDGQSASVQKFQQEGVTHVIVTDVELLAFQSSAQSQQYKPRYGVNSYNALYTNVETSPLAPPGAQNGAMGVGWAPALDVGEAQDPKASPGSAACLKIMSDGGQSLRGKRLAQVVAFSFCDVLGLVQRGAERAGSVVGVPLLAGMQCSLPRLPHRGGLQHGALKRPPLHPRGRPRPGLRPATAPATDTPAPPPGSSSFVRPHHLSRHPLSARTTTPGRVPRHDDEPSPRRSPRAPHSRSRAAPHSCACAVCARLGRGAAHDGRLPGQRPAVPHR